MTQTERAALTKVPAITLGFWIIKILATTFGETAGDSVSMSWLGETTANASTSFWQSGYLIGTGISSWRFWCWHRFASAGSTHGYTGRPSSPRPPPAQPWPILPRGRWASVIREERWSCWRPYWPRCWSGAWCWARCRSALCTSRGRRSSTG